MWRFPYCFFVRYVRGNTHYIKRFRRDAPVLRRQAFDKVETR